MNGPTSAEPQAPAPQPVSPGSLYQPARYRSYYRDDVPSHVGDSLTVVIQERASSSLSEEAKGSRDSSLQNGINGSLGVPFLSASPSKNTIDSQLGFSGNEKSNGKGSRSNNSSFTSSISVTVVGVLANGYLRVSGEKQVQVNDDTEQIRLSGTVNPREILPGNLVSSTKLTDVRLEQQTKGNNRLFTDPGWLTRFFMSVLPF
ncbi:flagellar basal body L-ring protein FlgH [Chromobacterium sphagni]|uniref:flagellar basal body L-ring protein FlgH n=1 Tax=Chromobacterium sphagni TaxID=1903179 RepID=UPI001EFB1E94|nr:flagellar basal body L-ring protein FlgH [Chromobacterium sphagni]